MKTLWPRPADFNVLSETKINRKNVMALTEAADFTWEGLKAKSINLFSIGFLNSFNAQVKMFPKMLTPEIAKEIDKYKNQALAWKLSGAGGGGYLILISEKNIPDSIRIKIRIKELGL